MDRAKEYKLFPQNVDFDKLNKELVGIENSNKDLTFNIYEKLPDVLIDSYCELTNEAERNVLGLLTNDQSYTTTAKIKKQYDLRNVNKFYFDAIILFEKKIIGRLNGWGYKENSPFFIFLLYVQEKFRGRKLGNWLLYKSLTYANNNILGLKRFELQTQESNEATQAIIKKIGFELK